MINFVHALTKLFTLLLAAALLYGCATGPTADDDAVVAIYYLVRHAEKLVDDRDPGLSPAGLRRAQQLAQRLRPEPVSHLFATDYRRTQETALPSARHFQLDVTSYDPQQLGAFAQQLKRLQGVVLVVGHSNTTPVLAELLGGEPGPAIAEATEFDRLYRIVAYQSGAIDATILRYGVR